MSWFPTKTGQACIYYHTLSELEDPIFANLPDTTPFPGVTRERTPVAETEQKPKRHFGWIFGVLGVLLAAAATIYIVHMSGGIIDEEDYVSPYAWSNLYTDDKGRLHYTDNSHVVISMAGIDCSEWDTGTDWAKVAADGVQFALIRVGYRGSTLGGLYVDKQFENAYKGAKDNGILVGLYFFSQATNAKEGREEAEFIIETLAGRELDLPIFFDHEGIADPESRAYGMSDEDYTGAAKAFCSRLEHAGYTVGIYGNRYAIAKLSDEVREMYTIWLAEWETDYPHARFDFTFWQFTNAGHVDGMWRRVDTSIWFMEEVGIKTPATRAAAAAEAGQINVDQLTPTEQDAPAPFPGDEPEPEPEDGEDVK